jgi:hypothetical protein
LRHGLLAKLQGFCDAGHTLLCKVRQKHAVLASTKHTESANIDAQVAEILAQLPSDPDIGRSLAARYKTDLFCGFMNDSNEGLEMSAETLSALGSHGIELGIDLYGPGE